MHNGVGWYWGMHAFWWVFWLALIVVVFMFALPASRRGERRTPLQILQQRYADGEISTDEFEERKAALSRPEDARSNT